MYYGDFFTKKHNQEEGEVSPLEQLKEINDKLKEDLDKVLEAYNNQIDLHRLMNIAETVNRAGNNTDDILSAIKELEVKCQESRYALFVRGILK